MTSTDEQTLRVMIRQVLARQPGSEGPGEPGDTAAAAGAHASHSRYALPESDGPCLIEPTVRCNHCGYCQSHGH